MTKTGAAILMWAPRLAGIGVALFLAVFALDAFDGRPLLDVIPGFAIHLAPSFLVLAVVAVAWRFPMVGAAACLALAVTYGVMVHWRFAWTLLIGGPLIVVAVLLALSARYRAPG